MKRAAALAAIAITLAPAAHAVPVVGGQGLTPNARAIVDYIQTAYPAVESIGGIRPCDWIGEHCAGRAVDIMIGTNMGLGDAIYADLSAHKGKWGIAYLIWRQADHADHIHVTVL